MLAQLHPFVVLDEHQDANRSQHTIAMLLRRSGAYVRGFADPMQQIFEDGEEGREWEDVRADADVFEELTEPFRWNDDLALGSWILDARRRLACGEPLVMATAPPSVSWRTVRGDDIRYGAGLPPDYFPHVRRMPRDGSAALLTARRAHMATLRRASANAAQLYEGSQLDHVYETFDRLEASLGTPRQMSTILLDLIAGTCTGLTAAYRHRIEQSLGERDLNPGRQHVVRPVIEILQLFYATPTFSSVARACRALLEAPPAFLRIERPAAFRILCALLGKDAVPDEALQDAVQAYKAATRRPDFAVSTIHRAKGLQFDHVLLSNVSSSHFSDDVRGRRLLYVAISRCRRSLTIVLPEQNASALVV